MIGDSRKKNNSNSNGAANGHKKDMFETKKYKDKKGLFGRNASKISSAGGKKKVDEKAQFRRNAIIVTAIAVLVIAVSVVIKANVLYTEFPAVKVGNYSFTAADYNYQFYSVYYKTYNAIYSNYGDQASSLLSTKTPLDQQKYSDTQTWADYFKEATLNNLQEMAILCSAANNAGYKLSDASKTAINSTIDGYKGSYKSNGYASLDAFLTAQFGTGMTESILRKNLENQYLAGEYYEKIYTKTYSNEDLNTFYNQNKDKFDTFTYRQYLVSDEADVMNGVDTATAMANAKAKANKIAAAKSETEFNNLVYQNVPETDKETYKDGGGTIYRDQSSTSFTAEVKDWLLNGSRKAGDVGVIEATDGYYVVYFLNRNDNSYNQKKVRHILIETETTDTSSDSTSTASPSPSASPVPSSTPNSSSGSTDSTTADQKAYTKAQDIYNQWLSGAKTEDSFSALAKTNSSDTGSASDGGYYEIYKGQMVAEFENWAFDSSRKPGDSGIVKTSYGYHIMYFVGDGEPYRYTLARKDKEDNEYKTWFDNQKGSFAITKTSFMRYTKQS